MPDLTNAELIERLNSRRRFYRMDGDSRWIMSSEPDEDCAEASARLTAAVEERERMELGHARLSAVRQSQYQAKEAEWIAEMEKRERAEASLTAAAERERTVADLLRLTIKVMRRDGYAEIPDALEKWLAAAPEDRAFAHAKHCQRIVAGCIDPSRCDREQRCTIEDRA